MIRDLNSMNGTYVHDDRVTQSILMPGDTFQLGAITFRVEYTSDTDPGKPRTKSASPADHSSTVPMLPVARTSSPPASATAPAAKKWWKFW
jgi:pSer/pThr/pTyr-binding forkhead associated (FHA) protein